MGTKRKLGDLQKEFAGLKREKQTLDNKYSIASHLYEVQKTQEYADACERTVDDLREAMTVALGRLSEAMRASANALHELANVQEEMMPESLEHCKHMMEFVKQETASKQAKEFLEDVSRRVDVAIALSGQKKYDRFASVYGERSGRFPF